ncbi:SURF1 family protein [Noviherbaspirillum denitrificans]|uniref:SURF1-like protein n=1 Tax=Noviherbaspirillum denitrificans TaxID=1968433 RepID=A0A254TDZ3_9BURK|nr:SURF1 family protein [Noviherbaspirillum denitrificans]OWW19532.1 hypothetical protein AYR66_08410 [Noviherbaspirillum denitrificans]
MTPATSDAPAPRRSRIALLALAACALLLFAAFAALGTWQLFRLQWKLDLIDRVEHRVHAPPVPAPASKQWSRINATDDEYKHVQLAGTFLHDRTTPVQATTELGFGYWLLTPLRVEDGSLVLVNRGFIPANRLREALSPKPDESASITGLLRMTEPGGVFPRRNDPAANRWYSRDVQGIAASRGLSRVAPYFVDADGAAESAVAPGPVGGLTVVSFHNNHLAYALTWYALALMVAGAAFWAVRKERRMHPQAAA